MSRLAGHWLSGPVSSDESPEMSHMGHRAAAESQELAVHSAGGQELRAQAGEGTCNPAGLRSRDRELLAGGWRADGRRGPSCPAG